MWADDDRIRTVLISAGGDLRAMHAGGTGSLAFWAAEYRLNAAIAGFPKPGVAWMDGLVTDGGVGVSAHASAGLPQRF